jgi:hypothetical protein
MKTRTALIAAAFTFASGPSSERLRAANQDEIQVYDDSINKPGQFGLEIHLNATPAGRTQPDYPGEITNEHGVRFTPEFSYGLTRDLEAGFYLDTQRDGEGTYYFVGPKWRLKWLPLHPDDHGGWFAGTNWEYSRVGQRFSQSQSVLELRTIAGYKADDWIFVINPVFDWSLSNGLASPDPDFTASFKFTHKVAEGLSAGVEYYGDIGKLGHVSPLDRQDQRLYLVADIDTKPWAFNIGIGRGFTQGADAWTVKAIVEVPVEEMFKK